MKQIKQTIKREKGYDYRIDRKGNIIKSKYNYFTDWRTYLMLLLLLIGYLYYSEVKTAREYIGSPCVRRCLVENYIQEFQRLNPSIKINCDYELGSCQFSGVLDDKLQEQIKILRGLNITIEYG